MDAVVLGIKQSLFIYTSPVGETWEFVALENGGCATLREGQLVASGDGSEESVERMMDLFLLAASVRQTAAPDPESRLPFPHESMPAA